MRLLKSIFNFNLKKAVNKRNALVFLLIAVILQIFLQVGNVNHSDILESKETFQRLEQQKTSRYLHYSQYGSFGIWIKLIPHVNSILYFDSTFDNLLCNVDSTYVFNVHTPVRGRRLLANGSRFLNFSVMFLLLGALFYLVYGMDTTVKKDYLKFISTLTTHKKAFWFTVITRLIILFLASLALYAISIMPLLVFNGINLFSTSFPILLGIILSSLFFFSMGCAIGFIKEKFTRAVVLGAVYFSMVILLPWALGFYSEISAKDLPKIIEYDFKNFKTLMRNEEEMTKRHGLPKANEMPSEEAIKEYKKRMEKMKKTFRVNEDRLKSQTLSKINTKQTISSFFPTLSYLAACESSSSVGVLSIIDFITYCQEKKDGFADFIIEKSFQKKDKSVSKKIENFIKGDEDLFFSKPKLPYKFWLGVVLTLVYSLGFLFVSYRIDKKSQKIPEPSRVYQIEKDEKKKDKPLFVLCKNESIKEDIFNYYQSQRVSVCIEKINTGDFMFNGIKANELLKHFCQVKGVDEQKALENLKIMGIKDLKALPVCHEIILKIYAAVKIAVDFKLIVLNDFLIKESREFERDFLSLLLFLEKSGKKIIYLSCQMKQTANSLNDIINVDIFEVLAMDLNNTSVR